ncbi:MAG: GNAT family N-acetyltransferase [Acidovorax sp.]|nr:GNAT family N-acetyltransferase [Acidovorax sp.]
MDVLAIALARHIGQALTVDVARQIVRDVRSIEAEADKPIDLAMLGERRCGSLVLRAERAADILPELEALHRAHFAETEKHRHGLPLAPDIEAGLADERRGALVQFTARHEGRLVGNLRMYLRTSRHTGTRFASEDTLYLLPEFRKGRAAMRLLQFMEDSMRALGVLELRASTKKVNRTDKLLEFMGWTPVATELVKFLPPSPR